MNGPPARERPTRLVLLGHPVSHSLSPRFHNAALRAAGIAVRYEALDTPPEHLASTLAELRREGAGGNVTIPLKESMRVACDRLTALAERVGAVNTFWFEDGALHGDNTDVAGFEKAAAELLGESPRDVELLLVGAGGAARAVLAAAERWPGARVTIQNRTPARAEALAREFPVVRAVVQDPRPALGAATLVVNATSVGMRDDAQPVDAALLPPAAAVLDLVYRRGETEWVRAARARGLRAADGATMLLEQGAESFRRWFGMEPDREVMRDALR